MISNCACVSLFPYASRAGVHRLLEASVCDFPLDLGSSLKILSSAAAASALSLGMRGAESSLLDSI